MTESFFSQSYVEARAKFVSAASRANARLTEYECPSHRGRYDERLTIDVATLGPPEAQDALLIISGTHGVEGFCGSGCQVGFLCDRLYEALPNGVQSVLVHGLNPFGFSWLRRANEVNVDLNRNFRDFTVAPPPSEAYEQLHDWLVPDDWSGSSRDKADKAIQTFIEEQGMKRFQAAVSGGQYTRPTGLFFGGTEPTWSNHVFRRIVRENLATVTRRLAVLDLHTGLGPTGYGEPISLAPDTETLGRAKRWYGPEVRSTGTGDSVSAAVTGSTFEALSDSNAAEVTAIALEFGTRPITEVLVALRGDHWLHATAERWAQAGDLRDEIKQGIRNAFYVDTSSWKAAVYGRTADIVLRAARAIGG